MCLILSFSFQEVRLLILWFTMQYGLWLERGFCCKWDLLGIRPLYHTLLETSGHFRKDMIELVFQNVPWFEEEDEWGEGECMPLGTFFIYWMFQVWRNSNIFLIVNLHRFFSYRMSQPSMFYLNTYTYHTNEIQI